MDQMNTKPTVIEGCVASYDDNGSTFCPASPGVADILASLVIGDKAVPISVVVEMLRDLKDQTMSIAVEQSIDRIAARFNITL